MVTLSGIRGQQEEYWKTIKGYSEKPQAPLPLTFMRMHTLAGILNLYIYCAVSNWDAIEKKIRPIDEDAEPKEGVVMYEIDPLRLKDMQLASELGTLEISVPSTYGSKYLRMHWPEARSDRQMFRLMRAYMRDHLGLFEFEDQLSGRDTRGKSSTPPILRKVDIYKLLAAYETIQKIIIDEYNGTQDPDGVKLDVYDVKDGLKFHLGLPKHKGMAAVLVFNEIFKGVCEFGRVDTPDAIYCDPAIEQPKEKPEFVFTPPTFTAYKRWKWWTAPQSWIQKQPKIATAWNQMTLQWERLISRDLYTLLYGEVDLEAIAV